MRSRLLFALLNLLPLWGWTQSDTYVGINLSPIIFRTLELHLERRVTQGLALQFGVGIRAQSRNVGELLRFSALQGYVQPRNRAVAFSGGARFFNGKDLEYPYIAVDIIGGYYAETLEIKDAGTGSLSTREVNGFKWGASFTIGYVAWLSHRMQLDLGLQIGYSPPREEVLAYYLPTLGFTTFGFDFIGVKGGHVQPMITFKYNLVRNRRLLIREKD